MLRWPVPVARALAGAAAALALATGCATTPPAAGPGTTGTIRVVAAESFWGSLAEQLGGTRVEVTSVIDRPGTDPHDYEPTVADARAVATARLVIVNGLGYDEWASRLADANPSPGRIRLTVANLVGARAGDNPHRWYDPDDVRRVVDRITADYRRLDPAHARYFDTRHDMVLNQALKAYFGTIDQIRAGYAGTPVGASESIFAMLAPALGLRLVTPPGFLAAVSEGGEPSARDKATIDRQLRDRQIRVYVFNSQNATPDVRAQIDAAKAAGIPVTAITETPTPAGASFEEWQVAQLRALLAALADSGR